MRNAWVAQRIYYEQFPGADNHVTSRVLECSILNLQVARSALKAFTGLVTAKAPAEALSRLTPSSAYLASLAPPPKLPLAVPSTLEGWQDLATLQRLLSLRAALTVARVARQLEPRRGGKKFGDLSWECVALSEAVVEAFLAKVMVEAVAGRGSLVQAAGPRETRALQQVVTFVSFRGSSQFLHLVRLNRSGSTITLTQLLPFPDLRRLCSSSSTAYRKQSLRSSNWESLLLRFLLRWLCRPSRRRTFLRSSCCAKPSTSRPRRSFPNLSG